MIPPHSYSSLKMLKTCPQQYWRSYIKKDLPFTETPEMKYGNFVHAAMEHRLRDGTALPADIAKHESFCTALAPYKPDVELKLGCRMDGTPCGFFDKKVYLRGKADVVVARDDTAGLYDWKTGKPYEDPFELAVQALLLRLSRPHIKRVFGHYVWLKTGEMGKAHDVTATAITWTDIKLLHEKAERMDAAQDWPKIENVLCGWCRVHDCQFNPEYAGANA